MGLKRRIESLVIDAIFILAPGLGEEEAEVLIGWLDSKIDGGIPISEDSLNNLGLREIHLQALGELPTHKKIIAALFAIPVGFEFEYVDAVGDLIGTLTFGKFGFDMETWLFGSLNESYNKADSGLNKWQENGKTVMSDGGRDRRSRRDWELDYPDEDNSSRSFSLPFSFGSILRILLMSGIGVLVLFVGSVVATGGGGPASFAGDYLGANVDGPEFDEVGFMANQAWKTVSCFGDEGCIREWQLNNTRRPGSEDVGETYKLNIKNFQVYGSGGNADVGYSSPSDSIPIYFLVQNARHGLKGIDASNVEYRVKVRDEGLLSSRNYCRTKWLDLKTSYGSEGDENVLIPGAASEPLEWQDQLTLRECGLLQPGPGNYINFVLEVKYDYSSQSTLYVDAMSQEHRRSQQIPIDFKRSETADTPVETFIETRSPLLFAESNGERTSIPFTARVGVHTDNRDIDYTIDTSEFVFEDSSITEDVDGSCQGLESVSGEDSENKYVLSEDLENQIEDRQRSDDGDIQWFNYQSQPPPASCTMRLSDSAEGVSRTGETLTMSADVEYTVKLEEKEESFQILNSRCSTANCPMLVPLRGENISEKVVNIDLNSENPSYSENEEYWTKQYAYCRGNQDAQNGCSVIESFEVGDRGNPIRDAQGEVVTIEEGDMAVDLSTADNSLIHCDSEKPENGVQSIDPNELETAVNSEEQALSKSVSGWRVESTESCS